MFAHHWSVHYCTQCLWEHSELSTAICSLCCCFTASHWYPPRHKGHEFDSYWRMTYAKYFICCVHQIFHLLRVTCKDMVRIIRLIHPSQNRWLWSKRHHYNVCCSFSTERNHELYLCCRRFYHIHIQHRYRYCKARCCFAVQTSSLFKGPYNLIFFAQIWQGRQFML